LEGGRRGDSRGCKSAGESVMAAGETVRTAVEELRKAIASLDNALDMRFERERDQGEIEG